MENMSVSEDRLRLLFSEFKLELLKELNGYATVAAVDKWRDEINRLFIEISGRLRVVEDAQVGTQAVSGAWKWGIGLAATFASAVIGALLYIVVQGAPTHR